MKTKQNEAPTTSRPHKPGTPPNFNMVMTPAELEYIRRVWNNRKSAAVHEALRRMMETEQEGMK